MGNKLKGEASFMNFIVPIMLKGNIIPMNN